MTDVLHVLLGGVAMASIHETGDRLTLRYDPGWVQRADGHPLSLSMPLGALEHGDAVVRPFLWGLLPDNDAILERWGQRFGVSPRNPFRLLAHVGEDCAGAAQLVRPERLEAVQPGRSGIEWLTADEVAERLRRLALDHAATRLPDDSGQFSLAGAQPKLALLRHEGRWGVPYGAVPTTHILEPPLPTLDGHAVVEHESLALARTLGLPAARSEVWSHEGVTAIVVERFDRARLGPDPESLRRPHQEDLCQALGVHPARKYQNEGGPGPRAIADLLRRSSARPTKDVERFRDALLFHWLTAGTDAHAKNYALLYGPGGRVRLAPLYDLASVLPFEGFDERRLRLAMKMGRTYRLDDVRRGDLARMATDLGLDPATTVRRAIELAEAIPDRFGAVRSDTEVSERLAAALEARAERCLRLLRGVEGATGSARAGRRGHPRSRCSGWVDHRR